MSLSEDLTALAPSDPRILTLDIETSPNIVYAWGIWNQNIATSQLIEPSRVLCFAAKWLDRKRVEFYSEQDGRDEMLRAVWSMIDEADVIVGYNHVKFDHSFKQGVLCFFVIMKIELACVWPLHVFTLSIVVIQPTTVFYVLHSLTMSKY